MSWIVALESEGQLSEQLREALAEDGWLVETASTFEAATAAIISRSPQLVLADVEIARAGELLAAHARARGGPGSLALATQGAAAGGDERLDRPFSAQDLRMTVRRLVTAGRAPATPPPADDSERLTSQELFGDMLAEVEREDDSPAPTAIQPPAARPPASGKAPDTTIDSRLSGLLAPEEKRPAAKKRREEPGVDDLLSKTLSGLEVGSPKRAAARPPAPTASPAPEPAAPRAPTEAAEAPAAETRQAPAPAAAETAPPEKPAAAPAPEPEQEVEADRAARKKRRKKEKAARRAEQEPSTAVDRILKDATPPPAPRRPQKELDLSSLDQFAKGRRGDRTPTAPDSLATQKVPIPASLRGGATGPVEFGQYTLLERIALGGMAEVWKARMKGVEGFRKTVAIKKILPHLTDSSDFVTMFIDEAKLAAQLNHTNIIHIYDFGKIEDDYYIAMEFVDGKDLRSILTAAREQNRPLPLGLALLICGRLASALDHAHHKKDFEDRELGLVHRDVSPQNVLISYDGDIKLCDFGIVKAVSKASKTQMGALKGKLQYMSPEQAWGRKVDARSDIFSLGSLLFETLTGRRLFTGETEMSVLDAVREGRIQAPRDLDPRVPLEVNALVLKALAREPKNRFQSAGDLQHAIDDILVSLKPTPTQRDLARYLSGLQVADDRPARATPDVTPEPAAAGGAAAESAPEAAGVDQPVAAAGGAQPDAALESASGVNLRLLGLGIAAAIVIGVLAIFLRGGGEADAPPAAPAADAESVESSSAVEPGGAGGETPAIAAPAEDQAAGTAPGDDETATGDDETTVEAAPPAAITPAPAAAAERPAPAPVERPAPPTPAPAATERQPQPTPAATTTGPAPATTPPAEKPAESPASEPAAPVAEPAPPAADPQPQTAPPPAPAPTRTAAATPQPTPPARRPSVTEGQLVEAGPDVQPPILVSFDKPEYPRVARRMKVEGTVVMSLLVDETGQVIDVRLERGVNLNVGINEAALAAARTARFRPATKEGVRVKTWHQLTIPFKL